MIENHKCLLQPNDNDIIWHYYSFTQFLYLLENRKLHFTRADKFEDKWEVLITEKDATYYKIPIESIPEIRDRDIKRTFMNCWTMSDHELALMWKAYTSDKEGIAIKSTVKNLKSCYTGSDTIYVAPVQYIDPEVGSAQPEGTALNTFWFSVTKRKIFEQEKELRLVHDTGKEIDSIYVAPNAEPWFVQFLKVLLKKYNIGEKIVQTSKLNDRDK